MKFKYASAKKQPKIACIGEIVDVSETAASKSGMYNVTKLKIEPRGGGLPGTVIMCTRPDWLVEGFSPDKELAGDNSALFVYEKNVASQDKLSYLLGLAGSPEKAEALCDDIGKAVTTVKDSDGNAVQAVPEDSLTQIIRKYAGVVGYVLKQKEEDTGERDAETGRKITILTKFYEVDSLFYPDEKSLARFRKLAASKPDDWRVGFDEAF